MKTAHGVPGSDVIADTSRNRIFFKSSAQAMVKAAFLFTLFLASAVLMTGCGVAHVKTQGHSNDLREYSKIVISDINVFSREEAPLSHNRCPLVYH